eukprot:gene6415-6646_t
MGDPEPACVTVLQQRAFLLARKREREARVAGRHGGSLPRRSPGGGYHDSDGDHDRYGGYDDESDDSFIEDDIGDDWRTALRQMTGYDPSRYKDNMFDDRKMEASAAEIAAEERRSARMGRAEDEREAEEEARRATAKADKKEKRTRKRGTAALFDD